MYELNGESNTLSHFCLQYNQKYTTVYRRLNDPSSDWTLEEALGLVPYARKSPPHEEEEAQEADVEPVGPTVARLYGMEFTRAGLNLMRAAAGEITGEQYLRAEGYPKPPPGMALDEMVIPRKRKGEPTHKEPLDGLLLTLTDLVARDLEHDECESE